MKPIYLCYFITKFVLLVEGGHEFRSDYTYFPEADGWLKMHRIPANWNDARLRCHFEGGNLASPLNAGLKNAIKTLVDNEKSFKCGIFTGIHATFSKGDFFSIEGVPLSKISHTWAKEEPDNFNDEESCIVSTPDGELADVKCGDTFPYICYKKATPSMVVNTCGTVDNEYVLDARTGSCYKFHRIPQTWSRACMTCVAEGGHLVIINSDTEATVVREIFAKNPATSIPGTFWKDVAFVGFHNWNGQGDWLTIEGQTLQEAGYAKFSSGEPNNSTTGEFCSSVYRTAYFNDLRGGRCSSYPGARVGRIDLGNAPPAYRRLP